LLLAGAKQVARGLSATWYAGLVSLFSARVERLADDLAVAETDFREALAVFGGMGERWFQGIAAIDLARLLLVQGRRSELAEPGDFIREVEGLFDPEFQMKLCAFRARELALDGEIPEALALADRAVAVAQTTDQLIFHAEVLRDRADILGLLGALPTQPSISSRRSGFSGRRGIRSLQRRYGPRWPRWPASRIRRRCGLGADRCCLFDSRLLGSKIAAASLSASKAIAAA